MFSNWKSDGTFDLSPRTASPTSNTVMPSGSSIAAASIQQQAARLPTVSSQLVGVPKDACSIINEWLTMRGELQSDGDILVKGRVHGNVRCRMLIIDAGAFVEGSIAADDVIVRGTARGTIRTKRVRLEKTAIVDSEIFHDSFAAEEGARIKGCLHANDEAETAAVESSTPDTESPEAKVSSALYQMLDVARTPPHLRLATGH